MTPSNLSLVDALPRTSERRVISRERRLASVIATQHEVLANELSINAVMNVVCRKVQELLLADSAGVAMVQGDALVYVAMTGPAASNLGIRLPVEGSLTGLALSTRQTLHSSDCAADDRVDAAACRRAGVRSVICVPLRTTSRSVGVLTASSSVVNAFEVEDIEILELMSGVVAAAIARASEYEAKKQLVDERERAARAMEQQTAMLRLVFDAAPQLIGVLQLEENAIRHLVVNPAMGRFFQRRPEELVGRTSAELGGSDEGLLPWKDKLGEAARSGLPIHFDYTRGTGAGAQLFSVTVAVLPSHPNEPHRRFAYVCDDVTDRSRLTDSLSLSERMACVGRLAAGVAHEVNNPLAYVNSNLAFVIEELQSTEALADPARLLDMKVALTDALGGVDRVVRIVRDLQTFVRSNDGLDGTVDLPFIVERCISLTHHETKLKSRVEVEPGLAPPVKGNEGQIAQVIVQLVVNAAQAMPRNGRPDGHLIRVVTGTTANGDAFVEVKDNGEGLTAEVMRRAFEPFFTTRGIGASTGIGLAVCRNIVEAHAGQISVQSVRGTGTTFRIELPSAI